jgi:phage terminase large subunit-like protein
MNFSTERGKILAKKKTIAAIIPALAQKFMLPTSHYDKAKADRVVAFINALKHTKGEWKGQPFILLPWQEDIIRTIFGVIGADGFRQCRTCYITLAKKGGKTSLAAAVALYMLCADNEFGAEIYSCAADRQQASLVYREAVMMAKDSPAISRRVKILESQKRIVYGATGSFYQVLSSEAYSHHGINPQAVLFDETHVADREMFRVMTQGSSDARRQPLHLFISTAGSDLHSVGYELHQKALDIRDGRKVDSSFLPVIFQLEDDDDWENPDNWIKANPSLGQTFGIDSLMRAYESAKQNPSEMNSFLQLRMNIWTKQSVRWMPMDKWDACAFAVDEDELFGEDCYAGLDLSTTTDISALVLVFPPKGERDKYCVIPYFWLPEETIPLRVRRDHVPYDTWNSQGLFFLTEGNVVHYEYIENHIARIGEKFNIKEIAFDRWNCTNMAQNLESKGLLVVPHGQGFKDMSEATKALMRLVLSEKIAHGGNPILHWMADNIAIQTDTGTGKAIGMDDAGNIKPSKSKSSEKIDGMVALIMALNRAMRNTETESVYSQRGILWI